MAKGVEVQLFDADGAAIANESGIEVAWFDTPYVRELGAATGRSVGATTDGSGWLKLDLSHVTTLAVGDIGFLVCYKSHATVEKRSRLFASRMTVASVTATTELFAVTEWTRPAEWLTMPTILSTDEKFAGLLAVEPSGSFVALKAEGNYTINWGDGSGNSNVASGVTAEKQIAWADADPTSDVGLATTTACTFTDAGDVVGLTAHGWSNGQKVAFNSITSTTGISTYTTYFVVNKTADTFQVATTLGGSALALTTNGSGSVYVPEHRQVIVTVVPNASSITKLNLHVKHSAQTKASATSNFLEIAVSFAALYDFGLARNGNLTTMVMYFYRLRQLRIINSDLRQFRRFAQWTQLASTPDFVTSTATPEAVACTFTDAGDLVTANGHGMRNGEPVYFTSITSTTGISIRTMYVVANATANTFTLVSVSGSAVTLTTNGTGTVVIKGKDFSYCFYNRLGGVAAPQINTQGGVFFDGMFQYSYSLKTVPLYDTSAGISFLGMFGDCYSLEQVPLFDLSAAVSVQEMFTLCRTLRAVPAFNLQSALNLTQMFNQCHSLVQVELLNTGSVTNFTGTFQVCRSLKTGPDLNTASATLMASMFSSCSALESVPLYDTADVTSFNSMFASCDSLTEVPLFVTTAATSFGGMFQYCYMLREIPPLSVLNTMLANDNIFNYCWQLSVGVLQGTNNTISYLDCNLSSAELDRIYTALATVTAKTITVTGNYGVTGDTPAIATGKGWTVTG